MSSYDFAKKQLREHLGSIITEPVSEGFWSIHASARELCEHTKMPDQILKSFQNMLTKIPNWTQETLDKEVERIKKNSGCDYLDDLIMGVFVSFMKAFASVEYGETDEEIEIDFERPTLSKFIHELYKNSARKLWQSAFLFKLVGVAPEQQAKNRQVIMTVIEECLDSTIRGFLPWSDIANKYFRTVKPSVSPSVPKNHNVTFGDDSDSDSESEVDSEEERPPLKLSDEEQKIDIVSLDEVIAQEVKPEKEPEAQQDILSKLGEGTETLVIKM